MKVAPKPSIVARCVGRAGGEHLGAEGARDLDRDVADAAGAAMDQHLLAGLHVGAVDQAFPGRDEDQRQGRGLAHRQVGGLQRQQVGIDRGEFAPAIPARRRHRRSCRRLRRRRGTARRSRPTASTTPARSIPRIAGSGWRACAAWPAWILVSSGLTPLARDPHQHLARADRRAWRWSRGATARCGSPERLRASSIASVMIVLLRCRPPICP